MNIEGLLVMPLLTTFFLKMVEGTIMCSTCRSDTKPDCESSPPQPQPCSESGSGVAKSCSTVRIFRKDTGDLHQFIRSCSSSQKTGCFDSSPGYRTCADICYTDGCNSALTLHRPIYSLLFLPLIFLLGIKLTVCAG